MLNSNVACECHQNDMATLKCSVPIEHGDDVKKNGHFKMLSSAVACECHQTNLGSLFLVI